MIEALGERTRAFAFSKTCVLTYTTLCRISTTECRILSLRSGQAHSKDLKTDVKQTPLANAELAIMDLLWTADRLTAREIREKLYPDATKAQHGTVQRLLQRLEEKGYVVRDRTIPIHFFTAAVSRQAYSAGQMEALADKLTAGSVAPLITHLVEEKKISREEIERIRAILDQHAEEGGEA